MNYFSDDEDYSEEDEGTNVYFSDDFDYDFMERLDIAVDTVARLRFYSEFHGLDMLTSIYCVENMMDLMETN